MPLYEDRDWNLPEKLDWEHVSIAVLIDIRRELKKLTRLLYCRNFVAIPHKLNKIVFNTTKRRRKAK